MSAFQSQQSKNRSNLKQGLARLIAWGRQLFPFLFTMVAPAIGSGILAFYLQQMGLPTSELVWLGLLSYSTIMMGLGAMHGTTLALVLGYSQPFVSGLLLWAPSYFFASFIGLLLANQLAKNKDLEEFIGLFPKRYQLAARQSINQLQQNGLATVFWFRLSPALPFALGTLLLGWLRANPLKASAIGLIGALPRTMVVMQIGAMAENLKALIEGKTQADWSFWVGLGLLGLSTIGLLWIGRPDAKQSR